MILDEFKNMDYMDKENKLTEILLGNKNLKIILERLEGYGLENYYVAAGAIGQTFFNYCHGFELESNIGDYDIVYFDEDISYEKEDKIIKGISELLKDVDVKKDIKNQARVHLWYGKNFGHEIEANKSLEEAISKWGTTITCIGVRMENGKLKIYASYGLDDLFELIIRPNKKDFIKRDYDLKSNKWKKKWPKLTIMPWDNDSESDIIK